MSPLLAALALYLLGAALSAGLARRAELSSRIGVAAAVAGGLAGLTAAVRALAGGSPASLRVAWAAPFGTLSLTLDPLAAAFLAPLCVIGALGALYGGAYLRSHAEGTWPGARAAAYSLLLAAMTLVTTASNTLLFLLAWEGMTLASFALVVSEHESRAVRRAGLLYLIAAHAATAALLLLFVVLGRLPGWEGGILGGARATMSAGMLFGLALFGFGTKAGVVPFHIWLPDAHSAAPGHVSALMSGVMITMGFYGLARFLPFLGPAGLAQAYVLIALGAAGAFGAIAHALVQRDVKRVLAYSTVENAGLVTMAIGIARLGEATGHPRLSALAWAAALFHLWSHALFKSLLFLGIGALAQATGSRDLEAWGGLLRRMPLACCLLLAGAAAAAALPPFAGLVSEWLILITLFEGALVSSGAARAVMVLGLTAAAATAALALASVVRLVGIGLLGAARSERVAQARTPGWEMTLPMAVLAGLLLLLGVVPWTFLRLLSGPVALLAPGGDTAAIVRLVRPLGALAAIAIAVTLGLMLVRRALARGRTTRTAVTWDCGYARPDPRMQYTASSLSEPIARSYPGVVRTRVRWSGLGGVWPSAASWTSQTLDRAVTDVYRPAFAWASGLMTRLRALQEPRVTTYLRYLVLALLVVLGLLLLPVGPRP